jgi:chromosome segregation ATPase
MKLDLVNFCCWSNKKIEIPDASIVLLTAPSGYGKTSIIRAIVFALFGIGQKVVKFGSKSCRVELVYKNLHIVRTKGPNKLLLNGVYEDEEAQHMIYDYVDKQRMFYLEQNSANSFVNMSPTDKLLFLENIAFAHYRLDDIKKRLKERIKTANDNLISAKSKYDLTKHLIDELKLPEKIILPERLYGKSIEDLGRQESEYQSTLKSLRRKKEEYVKVCFDYDRIEQLIQSKQEEYARVYTKYSEMKTVMESIGSLPDLQSSYNELEAKYRQHTQFLKYTDALTEHDTLLKEYEQSILNETQTLEDDLSKLNEKLAKMTLSTEDCKSQIEYFTNWKQSYLQYQSLQKSLEKLHVQDIDKIERRKNRCSKLLKLREQTYHQACNTYSCPQCEALLRLMGDRLVISEKVNVPVDLLLNHITELQERYKSLETEYMSEVSTRTQYEVYKSQIDSLEYDMTEYTLEEINDKLQQLEKYLHRYETLTTKHTYKTSQLQNVESKFKYMKDRLALLGDKTERLKCKDPEVECVDALERRLADIKYNLVDIQKKKHECKLIGKELKALRDNIDSYELPEIDILDIDELNLEIERCERELERCSSDYRLVKQYEYFKKEFEVYERHLKSLDDFDNLVKQMERKYTAAQRLKQLVLESESQSILQLIDTINTNVQIYLDAFFPDSPMIAELVSYKQRKKTKVPLVNITVNYKGNDDCLSVLSGGERDRLVLAYTLALVEMNNSPIILLDECVSSLDQKSANNVFEFLKTHCSDKLVILVAHQVVQGIFDSVIDLKNEK